MITITQLRDDIILIESILRNESKVNRPNAVELGLTSEGRAARGIYDKRLKAMALDVSHWVYIAIVGKEPLIKVGYTTRKPFIRLREVVKKYNFKRFILLHQFDCDCPLNLREVKDGESLYECIGESAYLSRWSQSRRFNEFFNCSTEFNDIVEGMYASNLMVKGLRHLDFLTIRELYEKQKKLAIKRFEKNRKRREKYVSVSTHKVGDGPSCGKWECRKGCYCV